MFQSLKESQRDPEPTIVYYYSTEQHPEILSPRLASDKLADAQLVKMRREMKYTPDQIKDILKEVAVFPFMVSSTDIGKLVSHGFTRWKKDPLYVHVIALENNRSAISNIRITSNLEQELFAKAYWKTVKDKHPLNIRQQQRNHQRIRMKFLESKGYRDYKNVNDFITSGMYNRLNRVSSAQHVIDNINHGDRDELSTMMPQLHLRLKEPLSVLESFVI